MTQGSVTRHILTLSAFIALSTTFQTLYFLADLYFVGRLGKEAIAAVGLGGNQMMLVLALTQTLGVGTTSLIAQALGRKDRDRAERIFNQSLVLSVLVGLAFGVAAFATRAEYCRRLAADATTATLGVEYLNWFIPALLMQFALVSMGAVLRGLGDLMVPTLIQVGSVVLNIVLAPVLIFGWGTGHPLGVAGAAIASFVAIVLACGALVLLFLHAKSHLRFRPQQWKPEPRVWGSLLRIGLPAGGEFALISVYMVVVYGILRPFGAAAQAGFGIGVRVMQSLFLPAIAVAFATAPVAGQNFGARQASRVRQSFSSASVLVTAVMLATSLLCQVAPGAMVRLFSRDPMVIAVGSDYLRIISWNFVATGVIFVSSSVFQGMGHTLPALGSSSMRLLLFAVPAVLLSRQPAFQIRQVWYLSLASVWIQLAVNVWLLHREFARKLNFTAVEDVLPLGAQA